MTSPPESCQECCYHKKRDSKKALELVVLRVQFQGYFEVMNGLMVLLKFYGMPIRQKKNKKQPGKTFLMKNKYLDDVDENRFCLRLNLITVAPNRVLLLLSRIN